MEFKKLDWDYTERKQSSFSKVVATHNFTLPEWVTAKKECKLIIYKYSYPVWYTATLWLFDNPIQIVEKNDSINSCTDCQILAERRLHEFIGIFINEEQ